MKRLILLVVASVLLFSCVSESRKKNVDKVLSGKKELRKFNVRISTTETKSAWFFLIGGGYNSAKSDDVNVRFYFKDYKGEYLFMERGIEDINVKIENVQEPYVTFNYDYNMVTNGDWPYYYIEKIVIHCKEEDFVPEININDLK